MAGEDIVDDEEIVAVPGFAAGGRVDRTGIALVHEGEYILPSSGSEAVITPGSGSVINYFFPIQIEVIGTLPDDEVQRVANYVFYELDRELATRA